MNNSAKNTTKYVNSLNNLLFDTLVQALRQDKSENLIEISIKTLFSVLELKNIFFAVFDFENNPLIHKKINETGINGFIDDLNNGEILFEKLESGCLAMRKNYIVLPIFFKGKLVSTLVLVKEELVRYVDPDFLLLYSQVFSSLLGTIQSTEDLSTNNKNLLEKEKIKAELLSTVSHELRTPMSNILGFSELLEKQSLTKEQQVQYQKEIYKSAKRLSNLINNFLDLSRIDSIGSYQLNYFDKAEIEWLAQEAWDHLKTINNKHEIAWHIENKLPEIICDSEAMTRLFINLFNNAIKYSPIDENYPQRKNISCSFEYDKKQNLLLITISDNGIGFESNEKEKIFERFYRSENAQKQYISGTGLGLWISQEIAKAHGGKLSSSSKINEGTQFYLELPLGNNISNATS
jgi:signal transduction histidine kinase